MRYEATHHCELVDRLFVVLCRKTMNGAKHGLDLKAIASPACLSDGCRGGRLAAGGPDKKPKSKKLIYFLVWKVMRDPTHLLVI